MMTKEEFLEKYNYLTDGQFSGKESINYDLWLDNLTEIPEGFSPVVGGDLILSSLTEIPEGFSPVVGGRLFLSSLVEIPENWNPINVNKDIYINNDYGDIKPIIKFMNFQI